MSKDLKKMRELAKYMWEEDGGIPDGRNNYRKRVVDRSGPSTLRISTELCGGAEGEITASGVSEIEDTVGLFAEG